MLRFFRRRRKQPLDFRGLHLTPAEALRRAAGLAFVLDVPVEKTRAAGFNGADPHHPFVITLRAHGEGACAQFRGSPMEDFYEKWQPYAGRDAGELEKPAPWRERPLRAANTAAGRLQRGEFTAMARHLGLRAADIRGHISGGPVTEAFGEVTLRRMAQIQDSVRRRGYRPEESEAGHLCGECFVHGEDFRVIVSSGKHRMFALLALGWREVPVQFGPPKLPVIVRREEVDRWPGVVGGAYSRAEALAKFDRLFADVHPSGWRAPQV
jgi:hypothetical protein